MQTITVTVGDELFRFASFDQWRNKARSWFKSTRRTAHDTICVDAAGRLCISGKEFMRADAEGAFPVIVYAAVYHAE